jgi:uncharacterized membrane protein YidH (DUF202 family)
MAARTLSLMVVGLAIDRFGLLFHGGGAAARGPVLEAASAWTSVGLVLLGVIMAFTTGARFFAYARVWTQRHRLPEHHGPNLGPIFAALVALFGILLLAIMLAAER